MMQRWSRLVGPAARWARSASSSTPAFGASEFQPFTLSEKTPVSHDTAIYKFDFESPDVPSGLDVVRVLLVSACLPF